MNDELLEALRNPGPDGPTPLEGLDCAAIEVATNMWPSMKAMKQQAVEWMKATESKEKVTQEDAKTFLAATSMSRALILLNKAYDEIREEDG
jgi:hypothetical protein